MSIGYDYVTAHYRIEQLEGDECALCEAPFEPGQELRPVCLDAELDLFAHAVCPEGGEQR